MRRNFVFVGIGVLFASRFRWENRSLHQYFIVADNVLFADFGNYTVNIIGIAIAWKISTVYYGAGRIECTGYDYNTQHTLSKTEHTQNGTLGEEFFYPATASIAVDACAKRFASWFGCKEN